MSNAFFDAISEAKYSYKNEVPTQEDFLATFKSFYLEFCATGSDDGMSVTNALNRAAVIYADDVAI